MKLNVETNRDMSSDSLLAMSFEDLCAGRQTMIKIELSCDEFGDCETPVTALTCFDGGDTFFTVDTCFICVSYNQSLFQLTHIRCVIPGDSVRLGHTCLVRAQQNHGCNQLATNSICPPSRQPLQISFN